MMTLERALRRVDRERSARKQAELLLEGKSRELFQINQRLERASEELEERVNERTRELAIATDQLRDAAARAEAASRAKSDFLARMSHEIRTPMNGVMGMTDIVLGTSLTGLQRKYLSMVKSSAHDLLDIINDILDFSKIEAGKLDLSPIPFNLRDQLGATVRNLSVRAQQKGLELNLRIAPLVPSVVDGDAGRLTQILVNLIGNAIKFTAAGEVLLIVDVEDEQDGLATLRFSVTDTGIGVPLDKQEHIFQPFDQADERTCRDFGGSGLGLTIASELAGMMGGRIEVQSVPGQGATFHMTAVLRIIERCEHIHSPMLSPVLSSLKDLRVLVLDANTSSASILQETLHDWGMQPLVTSDYAAALAATIESVRHGTPFALVLAAASAPTDAGFKLVQKLRQISSATVPVMMLSAASEPNRDHDEGHQLPPTISIAAGVETCDRLGLAHYIVKPVTASDLFDAVATGLVPDEVRDRSSDQEPNSDAVMVTRPLRILLAEDNLINQELALAILRPCGHTIHVADNGEAAVAAFGKQPFDLVLMDIQMPRLDGLSAARQIREAENPDVAQTPIIALTAHAMAEDRDKCLEVGMNGYVSKPIDPDQLHRTINEVIAGGGQAQALETHMIPTDPPSTPSTGASALPPVAAGVSNHIVLAPDELLPRIGGNMDLLGTLLPIFQQTNSQYLEQAEQAIAASDAAVLATVAHSLKGATANMAGARAAWIAEQIEVAGNEGSFENAGILCGVLKSELADLQQALEALLQGAKT